MEVYVRNVPLDREDIERLENHEFRITALERAAEEQRNERREAGMSKQQWIMLLITQLIAFGSTVGILYAALRHQ